MKLIEKHLAFEKWQEECTEVDKRREYINCCKRVRRAVREDKEKWLNKTMKEMEEDMRRHKQGNFLKKMKILTSSKVTLTGITVIDKESRPLYKAEEKLAQWKMYFEKVLNVQNTLEKGASVAYPAGYPLTATWEEGVHSVGKLKKA